MGDVSMERLIFMMIRETVLTLTGGEKKNYPKKSF